MVKEAANRRQHRDEENKGKEYRRRPYATHARNISATSYTAVSNSRLETQTAAPRSRRLRIRQIQRRDALEDRRARRE